jgi:1-deoxy-D-xylulose-5-phosphate synthase
MADNGYTPTVQRIGVPDEFVEHGAIPQLYHLCGMDESAIASALSRFAAVIR